MKFPPDHDQQKDGRRWRDEIAFAREIKHENIVQSVNVPEEFKAYLMRQYPPEPLIMEYCEKGDLRKKLQMQEHLNGMPEFDIRNIVKCMRNAIVHMHSKGISHRDIKPENLVIKEVNGCEVYKVSLYSKKSTFSYPIRYCWNRFKTFLRHIISFCKKVIFVCS